MSDQTVIVKSFSWRDLCPWTIILRTLPVAVSFPVLAWATVGLVLTPMGWLVSDTVFVSDEMVDSDARLAETVELNRSPYRTVFRATESGTGAVHILGIPLSGPRVVFMQMVDPFRDMFQSGMSLREFLYHLFGCIWTLIVWSFIGLAITRVALLRLTRGEDIDLDDSFDFAVSKFKDAIAALGMPLLAVLVLCVPAALIGVFMTFDIGVMIGGIFWLVVLALGLLMGLLLLGLMFGWPLMISSVSAEGQNSFDAMTRAYAYVFQRPLNYIFYAIVAMLFGGFCWLVVSNLTNRVVDLSYWAASWGTNISDAERIEIIKDNLDPRPIVEPQTTTQNETEFDPDMVLALAPQEGQNGRQRGPVPGGAAVIGDTMNEAAEPAVQNAGDGDRPSTGPPNNETEEPETVSEAIPETTGTPAGAVPIDAPVTSSLRNGRAIIGFWNGMLRTIAAAFIYGLFWCMASAIYLLLRRDVDETELDEIYLVDERRTYDLPPLQSDEHGIPQVQTPVPVDGVDADESNGDSPD
ncbi:MAG: hypothetical protein AAF456_05720 [Planctomycetota bacterium]